ncbi:beta-ketoacyl-[acyl-carrier-protein] synthase family protein [Pseudomonadota bacterium]
MSAKTNPVRRVAITGLGAISSIGDNADKFWRSCISGNTNVEHIPQHWFEYSTFNCQFWSPLPSSSSFDAEFTRSQRLTLDASARLAILTAKEALENAGYTVYKSNKGGYDVLGISPERFGVFMGTGVGGISSLLQNHTHPILSRSYRDIQNLNRDDLSGVDKETLENISNRMVFPRRVNPFIVSMLMPNAISANVGLFFQLTGPNTTYAVACASGAVAIGNAFRAIQKGDVDVALAGGSEYLDDHYGYIFRGFDVAGTLARGEDAETLNRPFDRDRTGFVLSQGGAATLILEEFESAISRGAPIVAEIIGYGETFDAYNIMHMSPDVGQIDRMIKSTLSDAGLSACDIDYINAHGTGTRNNDEIEAEVLYKNFGSVPVVNSTKALVGHSIGASGALEAVVTAKSLMHQTTHACKNLETPICDLNFSTGLDHLSIDYALSQSFAFGGHNSALAFKKFDA